MKVMKWSAIALAISAATSQLAMAEGYDSIKVDPLIFSNQPDGKGPWKITGPLEHKVIKLDGSLFKGS